MSKHRNGCFSEVFLWWSAENCLQGIFRRPLLLTRFMNLLDVCNKEVAAWIRSAGISSCNYFDIPLSYPMGRNEGIFIKHTTASKILFQTFKDNHIWSY